MGGHLLYKRISVLRVPGIDMNHLGFRSMIPKKNQTEYQTPDTLFCCNVLTELEKKYCKEKK